MNYFSIKECKAISIRRNQFIFAGRLDKIKGIDKLLNAWKLLYLADKSIPKLIVCGTGPEEKWCSDFVKSNDLFTKVKLMGFVDNSEVVKLINRSLALILPTQWYEGFPMSIVEAYGNGIPVLGSNIGNVGSLVIDGVTGYTFDPSSPKEIADTVINFLSEKFNGADLYKSTFKFYIEHYGVVENYSILKDIYNSALILETNTFRGKRTIINKERQSQN